MAITASYWPARSLTKIVSPRIGPTTPCPSATALAIVGSETSMSCRPTGMGVECGDRNAAAGDAEREKGLMGEVDDLT